MVTGVTNTVKTKRKAQVGKETVYGTAVAQTKPLHLLDIDFADQGTQRSYIPAYWTGVMSTNQDTPTITRTGAIIKCDTDWTWEEGLLPFYMGMKGAVTAAEITGGQSDFLRIFTNTPTTFDPTPDPYTFAFQMSGSGNFPMRMPGALCRSIEISADVGGDVTKLSYELWGHTTDSTALTVLALTDVTEHSALAWKFGSDTTWAAMDTLAAAPSYDVATDVTTTVRRFTWRYTTGIEPANYIGQGVTHPSIHRPSVRGAELELEVEGNTQSLTTWKAVATSGSKVFIRLLGEGARIGTGYNRTLLMQGAYIFPDGGYGSFGPEADGADTVTLRLQTVHDTTSSEDIEVRTINTQASAIWV